MDRVSPKVRAEWQARVDRLNKSGRSVGDFAARVQDHPASKLDDLLPGASTAAPT